MAISLQHALRRAPLYGLDFLYPPLCPNCGAEAADADALCAECWRDLVPISEPACRKCSLPMNTAIFGDEADGPLICGICQEIPPNWHEGRSAALHEGAARQLVLSLKHGDRLEITRILSRMMLRAGGAVIARSDVMVPVPLHWSRRLRRGANQSAEIARALAALTALPHEPTALRRLRRTERQIGKNRAEREANLKGAIVAAALGRRLLPGRRVLLIDDVYTTGATLSACTRALSDAGAREIRFLTATRVAPGGNDLM